MYFANTMKSKGYDWNFDEFADKYSSLDINDMVSLYEWQHGKASQISPESAPKTEWESAWAKSVIAWANPTTEVGEKKLSDMKPDEIIKFAQTQSWYNSL
jgi:hypothetical protein